MGLINQVRGYHFLLGVLRNQKSDPYCSVCSAYANTLKAARENLATFAGGSADALAALGPQFAGMLAGTLTGLDALSDPSNPSGQKKAGNCKLPQGVCFIKASFALVQQI